MVWIRGFWCQVLGLDSCFRMRVVVSYSRVGFGLQGSEILSWEFETLVYAVKGLLVRVQDSDRWFRLQISGYGD